MSIVWQLWSDISTESSLIVSATLTLTLPQAINEQTAHLTFVLQKFLNSVWGTAFNLGSVLCVDWLEGQKKKNQYMSLNKEMCGLRHPQRKVSVESETKIHLQYFSR